jgi:4-aminobutyrate aminotransferase
MSVKSVNFAQGVARNSNMVANHALGCWVTDIYDRTYLDMTSGIGALSTGHSHPHVVAKVREQVGKLVHAQQNCMLSHPPQLELISRLTATFPSEVDTIFFTSSGSEAVENSVKLARKATGRTNLISFVGGFHGRTLGGMSLSTSKTSCRQGYQPLVPGIFHLDYPKDGKCLRVASQLHNMLDRITAPDETAAIILEPVLGEGGVYQADAEFVRYLRKVCDEHGILWISDEVQTGMGRTGEWWGYQHFGVEPDIIIFGKGIASGYPLAGVAAASRHFHKIHNNGLGGTYNGNVVATEAANATLDVFQTEHLISQAVVQGAKLAQQLRDLQDPLISEIRQYGLMLAIDLKLSVSGFRRVMNGANNHNIMILTTGIGSTVRLLPPLTINDNEISVFISNFQKLLNNSVE